MSDHKLKAVIRVDAATMIGTGHLMRCLSMASRLRTYIGADVTFVSRDLPGNLFPLIRERGFRLLELPRAEEDPSLSGYLKWLTVTEECDAEETIAALSKAAGGDTLADLLIVDSYAIDEAWERRLRPYVSRILAVDDLANRKHDADVLLDQNIILDHGEKAAKYRTLLSASAELVIGPEHALLRDEFFLAKPRTRGKEIKRLLVFYGGADATNETEKAINAVRGLGIETDIITGGANPYREHIEAICKGSDKLHYHTQVNNMAEFMERADLMLGAGGSTTLERCYLGLPCLVTAVAENQRGGSEEAERRGYIHYMGYADEVTCTQLADTIKSIASDGVLPEMSQKCRIKVNAPQQETRDVLSLMGL